MEFLPHETHRVELNLEVIGKVMACVDGRTNTWRLDPDSQFGHPLWARAKKRVEKSVAWIVQQKIKREGYLPAYSPDARIETPVVYAIRLHPGSSAILARNYEPEPPPPNARYVQH